MIPRFLLLMIWLFSLHIEDTTSWRFYDRYWYLPSMEKLEHDVDRWDPANVLSRQIPGAPFEIPESQVTPHFRRPEEPLFRYYQFWGAEEDRPFRMNPFHYFHYNTYPHKEKAFMTGCTCSTVFKRYHVLGTCALITSRHILTTATSTEVILKNRRHFKHMVNILGFWYDTDYYYTSNSSIYGGAPARIHYHPRYLHTKDLNRTHPLPAVFDLAIWTSTGKVCTVIDTCRAYICDRGGSGIYTWRSPLPAIQSQHEYYTYTSYVAGYLFIKAYKRNPLPWFKYILRTKRFIIPCPKVEWGWFLCTTGYWSKLGFDSGGAMFRVMYENYQHDGLVAMNSFSMKLRSKILLNYFQILNIHPVLDFIWDAYTNNIPYEWLDSRFIDTKGVGSPKLKPGYQVRYYHYLGQEVYQGYDWPNY